MRVMAATAAAVALVAGCAGERPASDAADRACDSARLEEAVAGFGRQLRQVSLLAPDSVRATEMRRAYRPYVTDSLLQSWLTTPDAAPGRDTSSPWPVRIEILSRDSVTGGCVVQGNVIYTAGADTSTVRGELSRAVSLTLVGGQDGWRISAWESGSAEGTVEKADASAARRVLQKYYADIEAGEYRRAYERWGDGGRSSHQTFDEFRTGFAHTAHVEVQFRPAGRVEGAAGSRFVEIPVVILAISDSGAAQRFEGSYTLRRVVVDGATAAQRRWHLYDAEIRPARSP